MSRSPFFNQVQRAIRLAQKFESEKTPTGQGLESISERQITRRSFLTLAGAAGLAVSPLAVALKRNPPAKRVAIIGGGLAGLSCADRLQSKGIQATIYEAGQRLGGRCFSNRTLVPGMACENGGEFLDTGHKQMLGYANEFGLPVESVIRQAGEERYFFFGRFWSEAEVVDEFRAVVANMQADVHAISGAASFYSKNEADIFFDQMDLASYFASRCSGYPLIEAVLNEAYLAEYGLETSEQSTLNFLGFMRLNKQSKFEPFGVSDERFHLVNGNDGIVQGLSAKISGPKNLGAKLTRLGKNAQGEFLLYFNGSSSPQKADFVVLTVPFSVLRLVQLDASLGLSADKIRAIQTLGYGNNAKTMVAFNGRHWATALGSNGGSYSDLPNLQNTWETNRANAGVKGIITDYASGNRGAHLRLDRVQQQVSSFLDNYEVVFPGSRATATKVGNRYVAHLQHWPSDPLSQGSYTCYKQGQFTGIEGLNSEASGPLKFGGEHADSFYSWQGYMEGACLSGLRCANEVLADIKNGA